MAFSLAACGHPERYPEQPKETGLYTLQEAYDNGWLSRSDLKSIAYYYHDGLDIRDQNRKERYKKPFIEFAVPKDPEALSEEVKIQIRKAFVIANYTPAQQEHIDMTNTSGIIGYFGTYNDCVIVRISYHTGHGGRNYRVGGVRFRYYTTGRPVLVWIEQLKL